MNENKDQSKKVSTCFEGSPCAEMLQTIMGEQGIGSLCDEMMKSMMGTCPKAKEDPQKDRSAAEVQSKDPAQERGSNKQEV